jgi:hypothetical protein
MTRAVSSLRPDACVETSRRLGGDRLAYPQSPAEGLVIGAPEPHATATVCHLCEAASS